MGEVTVGEVTVGEVTVIEPSAEDEEFQEEEKSIEEQMYCSQQILIPPTFPYLLRQFAKAAIRTQPSDLLRWSTTYFRCLSLNIPPPVKPRLEYPLPRDFNGLTPGWLRALIQQMPGIETIPFRVLWDRWIGACLKHHNLIQILCLGGFEDNTAVPWLRFIALCAAHLTESLTETMMLICEVITEEPEGGSAMIPAPVFLDLYQFLARIDASFPQTLRNYYFLDKFLELFREKIAKDQEAKAVTEEVEETASSLGSYDGTQKTAETRKHDEGSVVSCPSVTSQDPDNFLKLLMKIHADEMEEEAADQEAAMKKSSKPAEAEKPPDEDEEESDEDLMEEKGLTDKPKVSSKFQMEDETTTEQEDTESRVTRVSSENEEIERCKEKEEQLFLKEDLERLRKIQEELMGEDDQDMEKFKQSLLVPLQPSDSQMAAAGHFVGPTEMVSTVSSVTEIAKVDETSSSTSEPPPVVEEREFEETPVDAVPGIGIRVPEKMIGVVCEYINIMAELQHNMIMPRNITHFECPPMEIVKKSLVL